VAGHVLQGLSDGSREGVRNMARRRAWRKRVHEPQPRRRVAHQLAEHLVQAYPRVRAGSVRLGDSLDRGEVRPGAFGQRAGSADGTRADEGQRGERGVVQQA